MKKIILFILGMVCMVANLQAQQISTHRVTGTVLSAKDDAPLIGATIKVKNTNKGTITDAEGHFSLPNIAKGAVLNISSIGYAQLEISIGDTTDLMIYLQPAKNMLDETLIRGYGTTTQRLNTGSISTITAKEIAQQPVTNVLAALSGRMPGVHVQTQNGLPGGGVSIQIRGKNSISAGTAPLYIIDGVPYPAVSPYNNTSLGDGITGPISPFSSLNPNDIESISVLKDADATAIYGSRGANGVIIITTKHGTQGKTKVDINVYQGIKKVANFPRLLNLPEYLQIRKEAFVNDGLSPSSDPTSPNYAPDLTVWDDNISTDWAKYIMGATASVTNAQGSISGGNENIFFRISGNYHRETSVIIGNNQYRRMGASMNIRYTSTNRKFKAAFSTTYNSDNNHLSSAYQNSASSILIPPNFPIYDQSGKLNWDGYANPLALSKSRTISKTDNIVSNGVLQYEVLPELVIKTSLGYNKLSTDQIMTYPISSQNPSYNPVNYSYFGHSKNKSIIIEPQLTYKLRLKGSTFNALLGGSYQSSIDNNEIIYASGFSNENQMRNLGSATIFRPSTSFNEYKYISFFGRINYELDEKYLLNASVRRDGSSRFGPGNRFGNFGAIGGAWLFGKEKFIQDKLPFVSYGKIRFSYGITGNDQITNYQYLAAYRNSGYIYEDTAGLTPSRIANSDFRWESNKKTDIGIELGIFKEHILFIIDRYWNHSENQLVNYSIPYLTGFSFYQANLPALVENTGWEIDLHSKNIQRNSLTWSTDFNLTLPKNRLKYFPNFKTSSYSKSLVVGEDITRVFGYRLSYIDPETGNAHYETEPGSDSQYPYLFFTMGKETPDFYGGIGNTLTLNHHWQLNIFCSFVKQTGRGGLIYTPGRLSNNFNIILNRWQKPGDKTSIPKATTSTNDYYYSSSSGNYFNTSYFRVKNISLAYSFMAKWLMHLSIDDLKIYAECQNAFTFWDKGIPVFDPETGASGIPPMKTFVIGIQVSL